MNWIKKLIDKWRFPLVTEVSALNFERAADFQKKYGGMGIIQYPSYDKIYPYPIELWERPGFSPLCSYDPEEGFYECSECLVDQDGEPFFRVVEGETVIQHCEECYYKADNEAEAEWRAKNEF